tara:strand:- start:1106 stop:1216 length:111 start_codon:yes stop_codon:yes gene_type:complete
MIHQEKKLMEMVYQISIKLIKLKDILINPILFNNLG